TQFRPVWLLAATASRAGCGAARGRPAWRDQRRGTAMQVIDAQVHIWGSGTPSGHHRPTSSFTAEELIAEMDAAGVDGAVLHTPSWDAGSNEMAVEAARKYPDKFCILGWFPI